MRRTMTKLRLTNSKVASLGLFLVPVINMASDGANGIT